MSEYVHVRGVGGAPSGMEPVLDYLCATLRQRRKALGLTQAEVAVAAGLTRNHYQLLETGKSAAQGTANPRLTTLVALAEVLDVHVSDLLPPKPRR